MTQINNYLRHYSTAEECQRNLFRWLCVSLYLLGLQAVYGASTANASEEQSAFVSCMETKLIEVFRPPESVYPMLRLQAQITEREVKKLAEKLNMTPTALFDLELDIEQDKSPRNHKAVMVKELQRQCSKHIQWSGS